MEEKKLVPKKRFKRFANNEPWIQNQLGEYGYFYYGRSAPKWSISKNAEIPCIRYGELYTRYSEKIEDIYSFTNISPEKLRFSKGTEILIPRVGEDPLDFANCSWLSISDVAIGEMISVYNTDQDPLFTSYMFNGTLKYEFAKRVEGGNVSNLYYYYLENILVSFPTLEEQQKIGEFFKVLDERIANQERKIAKVKALKSAYLTEMFPQEGETVPKRRFKGFEDEWGQSYLLDNIKKVIDFRGRTPKKLGLSWSENGYLALSALNVKNGYIDYTVEPHYGDEELYNKWMSGSELKKGQVIFTTEAPMGNVAQVPDNKGYILSQRVIVFDCYDDKISNDFLAVLLRSNIINKKLTDLSSGGTAKGVSQKTLESLKVQVPSLEEQQKIGEFFRNLDNQIQTEEAKLDKLKKMKEAYLEEMFV